MVKLQLHQNEINPFYMKPLILHIHHIPQNICCVLMLSCGSQYGCKVKAFVTKNAANMEDMRKSIEENKL